MKRIKKINKLRDLIEAAKYFEKIGAKQVIGHGRIAPAGKPAINIYELEDGTHVIEDDAGKKLEPNASDFEPVKRKSEIKKEDRV